MINAISIKNFQSHKDSELEFVPGVNVIVGASDSGKSSIIRAMRWLVWNRPTGDSFRSHWGGNTSVTLELDNAIITRMKSDENKYILGDSHFRAIGTEVPKEISDVLNFNDVNLQRQLDAPFLLSQSAGEVAQHFNKVAHLDKIDSSIRIVQSRTKEIERDITFKTKQLEEQTEKLASYDYLDKFEAEVDLLETQEKKLESLHSTETKLYNLIEDIRNTQLDVERLSAIFKLEDTVNKALAANKKKYELLSECCALRNLIDDLSQIIERKEKFKILLEIEEPINNLTSQAAIIQTKNKNLLTFQTLLDNIEAIQYNITTKEIQIEELQEQFDKEMPSTCPLCGNKIKK